MLCFCCVAGLWLCAGARKPSDVNCQSSPQLGLRPHTKSRQQHTHLSLHPRQRLHYAAHIYRAAERRGALIILWIMKENNKFCISPFVKEPMPWVWRAIQSLLHIIYIGTLCIAPRTNFYVIPSDAAIKVSFYVAADLWRPGWWRTGNILRHCIRPLM